jgi:hypothetical protein
MAYLKTVLVYDRPSEAEVDKAFLESHGLTVCLLNANTSRNELGAPFYIRLQVADSELTEATRLLREANPARFGSPERVNAIEQALKRSILVFIAAALAVGAFSYWAIPGPIWGAARLVGTRSRGIPNLKVCAVIALGLLGGMVATSLWGKKPGQL